MQRHSIVTNDLKHCIVCGKPYPELHEVFFGPLRDKSIHYGLVVPLCAECHRGTNGVHGTNGKALNMRLKKLGQRKFEEQYSEDFTKLFGRNYL